MPNIISERTKGLTLLYNEAYLQTLGHGYFQQSWRAGRSLETDQG